MHGNSKIALIHPVLQLLSQRLVCYYESEHQHMQCELHLARSHMRLGIELWRFDQNSYVCLFAAFSIYVNNELCLRPSHADSSIPGPTQNNQMFRSCTLLPVEAKGNISYEVRLVEESVPPKPDQRRDTFRLCLSKTRAFLLWFDCLCTQQLSFSLKSNVSESRSQRWDFWETPRRSVKYTLGVKLHMHTTGGCSQVFLH